MSSLATATPSSVVKPLEQVEMMRAFWRDLRKLFVSLRVLHCRSLPTTACVLDEAIAPNHAEKDSSPA